MSETWNIILWTTSISLALFGIGFGLKASINSSKANKNIKKLIASTWTTNQTQSIFFTNLKNLITSNRNVLKRLKSDINYYDYSIISNNTRLPVVSKKVIEELQKTEYDILIQNYQSTKKELDKNFHDIFKDKTILKSEKNIIGKRKEDLIDYHRNVSKKIQDIIKNYAKLSSNN